MYQRILTPDPSRIIMIPRLLRSRKSLFSTTNLRRQIHTDVLIVGGGVVGCALARQLTQRNPELSIGLIEAGSGPSSRPMSPDTPPNPRSYALSPASLALLGLDQFAPSSSNSNGNSSRENSNPHRLGFYDSMQIWEAGQPASLVFDAQADLQQSYLGAVVEDATLLQHLWPPLADLDSDRCRVATSTRVLSIETDTAGGHARVTLESDNQSATNKEKSSGSSGTSSSTSASSTTTTSWTTSLVVGADGAQSTVRRLLGLPRTHYDYGQAALTGTVQLATPHRGRAWQRFTAHGPLALLPTFSIQHAIFVWSVPADYAAHWKSQPTEDLVRHINDVLHEGPSLLPPLLGSLTSKWNLSTPFQSLLYGMDKVVDLMHYGPAVAAQEIGRRPFWPTPTLESLASPLFGFPLSTGQVHRYTAPRIALVGDAAHTMHPMAGQGLNLGLQDVTHLAKVIAQAADAGMDVATFLEDYDKGRKLQCSLTLAGIHSLHGMFGVQHVVAKHVKSLGMNAIQNIPPLRRALVEVACRGVATQ